MPRKEGFSQKNLFQELLKLRDTQRQKFNESTFVVDGEDMPWEVNPLGILKWYLHPSIEDTAIHSLIFYMQKIPSQSRSGRLRVQGGQVINIVEGSGYTIIDGEKLSWQEGDVLQIPLRWEGVVFQDFNDTEREAILICAEPNFVHSLGVDRGSGFEVLETAPEYKTIRPLKIEDFKEAYQILSNDRKLHKTNISLSTNV